MELLKSYLHSVKLYLPKGQKDDIIKELSDDLQSQMEEKERTLGRSLTEDEQADILRQYGDPMTVANRYRKEYRSVAFGRVLISAEMFPVYVIFLCFNLAVTALIVGLSVAKGNPLNIPMLFVSLAIQFVVVTGVVVLLDFLRRKFPKSWLYPPMALGPVTPIPRWQSVSGLVVFGVFTLWWAAVPYVPSLFFGRAAGSLELTPVWHTYYVPILVLLLAGIGQRAINLVRPLWTWVHAFTRMVTNLAGLFLQYFIIVGAPYVVVADSAKGLEDYAHLAEIYNALITWGVLCWLWVFLLINALAHAWQCVLHLRRWMRFRATSEPSHVS